MRHCKLIALFFLLSFLKYNNGAAQQGVQSIYLYSADDASPIPYAFFFYHIKNSNSKKEIELSSNQAGIINLTGPKATDSICFMAAYPGFDTLRNCDLVKNLYGKRLYLKRTEHPLDTVSVKSNYKGYTVKPNEISVNWSHYQAAPTDPLVKTITKLPHITNKSINPIQPNLQTIGNKKVIVYFDGRRLSDAEIISLPSILIAQAKLVTYPPVTDAAENTAVLYLSSAGNLYAYHFEEIRAAFNLGATGPSITYRHAGKKGNWSNDLMLNMYKYSFKENYLTQYYQDDLYQKDTLKSKSQSLVFSGSVTHEGQNGDLLSMGLFGNVSQASNNGISANYSTPADISNFFSTTKNINANGGLYVSWMHINKKGNTLQLNSTFNYRPVGSFSYEQKTFLNTGTASDLLNSKSKPTEYDAGIGGRLSLKKKKIGNLAYTSGFNMSFLYRTDEAHNMITTVGGSTDQRNRLSQSNFYGGYWGKFEGKAASLNLSLLGNYAIPSESKLLNYNKGYLYPRLVGGYTINKKQSLTVSLSAPTYRPAFSSMIADSSFRNNWLKRLGNYSLKAEHAYNSEILYNLEWGKAFSLETALAVNYTSNGLVNGIVLDTTATNISFLSAYYNVNYLTKQFSMNLDYTPQKNLKISLGGIFGRRNFYKQNLNPGFRNGNFYNGNVRLDYSSVKCGDFTFLTNWDGQDFTFMKKEQHYVYADMFYSRPLSKSLTFNLGLYDIFNSAAKKNSYYNTGINTYAIQNRRTISISLIWKIGQLFATKSAADNSSIKNPDDIKK
ncbi:MAG: hypothetical protein QM640_00460 [Niabella sp.]